MRSFSLGMMFVLVGTVGCDPSNTAQSPDKTGKPAATAAPTATAKASDVSIIKGDFKTPESVLYDPAEDVYLVSNINGSPLAVDGNGFISRVSPKGTIEALKWIDGAKEDVTLNAPKGMALSGGVLYVADLTHLRKFDQKTGAPKGEIEIPGATFVNDVAAGPDGTIYCSDSGLEQGEKGFGASGTDAVYQIDPKTDQLTPLLKDPELGRPNGLYADAKGVWVVTFGSGELYRIADGKREDIKKLPKGSLDGIVGLADGKLLLSSWAAKGVYRGPTTGPFDLVVSGVNAPADIGYDTKRKLLLIPMFNDHQVQVRPLK